MDGIREIFEQYIGPFLQYCSIEKRRYDSKDGHD